MEPTITPEMTEPENPQSPNHLAPMVLFCSGCRAIVGDSYTFLGGHKGLCIVSLYGITENVNINEELVTSYEGVDLGSTYTEMTCSNCGSFLGRVYKTTPRSLDHIRDLYSFSVKQVTPYYLGPKQNSITEYDLRVESLLDIPSIRGLQEQVTQLQRVMCFFNMRLDPVERHLAELKHLPPHIDKTEPPVNTDNRLEASETILYSNSPKPSTPLDDLSYDTIFLSDPPTVNNSQPQNDNDAIHIQNPVIKLDALKSVDRSGNLDESEKNSELEISQPSNLNPHVSSKKSTPTKSIQKRIQPISKKSKKSTIFKRSRPHNKNNV